jgi:hypothetical protein
VDLAIVEAVEKARHPFQIPADKAVSAARPYYAAHLA